MAQTDREALVALYKATGGAKWKDNHNWNTDADLSQWHGVQVNGQGCVGALHLPFNNLRGHIPPQLGDLGALKYLYLYDNKLDGPIPPELGQLAALQSLNLGKNELAGPIPPELGNLLALKHLYLNHNKLSGPIPPELGNLAALQHLDLRYNQLSGPIPKELGNLSKLRVFWLSNNQLTGTIPKELGKLVALKELKLERNNLSGHIPAELGALSKLQRLELWNNKLTGAIPPELGKLGALQGLSLSGNKLSDPTPPELGNLAALLSLQLQGNELSGPIPPELGDLRELRQLWLEKNNLTGPIPKELGALIELQWLSLSNNQLSGAIPKALGALSKLEKLALSFNRLTGSIPKELGDLSKLEALQLSSNKLTGPIPPELGNLTVLEGLDLSGNNLSGTIPAELGKLISLKQLYLRGNNLSGPIPKELGALSRLKELWLQDNMLTEIPQEVLELCRGRLQEPSWENNPWSRPPSTVLESGLESALGWWADVKRFGEGKSNKLKLVLVGLAEAGKTTIVRHFTGGSVPTLPDRTVGIEITPEWRPLDESPLQVSVWDFAGQEDYYSSHQLFLTKGALFLLVVDLRIFYDEVQQSGVDNFNDRHGRVYWWLEMLHMRVPGAALALVGSHVDQMEEKDADRAGAFLHTVVRKFIEDKAKNASTRQSSRCISAEGSTAIDTDHPRDGGSSVQPFGSREVSATPLVLHFDIFKVSLARTSVTELRQWIVKAASAQECPPEFILPALDQAVPKAWIEAYDAMDVLRGTTPCVLWSKAVNEFSHRMGGSLFDAGEVLLRAMQQREAEGGVLLSLANPSDPVGTDMLHLDPAWLIELVRRLTDHNLVDSNQGKQNNTKDELREYATETNNSMAWLWETHKEFCKSGCLNAAYLRFLWMHRNIESPGPAVVLSDSEFESVVSTMARLLVMYGSNETDKLVVPARLPAYGPESVIVRPPDNITDILVTVQCSFGQVYPPPGIVGRFLAWSAKKVHCFDECWQHGAFLRYSYDSGQYRVFFYESIAEETLRGAGLTLGVQAPSAVARNVLAELKASLQLLVADSAYGYPGLKFSMLFGNTAETEPTLLKHLRDVRALLDNQEELVNKLGKTVDRLEETASKLGGVADQLVQQELLAASAKRKEYPYPRLVILVPDGEADGKNERIQRVGWDRWTKAWESLSLADVGLHHNFRLRFLCEHNLEEVPCGTDGRGYPIEQLKAWVKKCVPLLKASLWILRVAVGTVSHVDLPLNQVLEAAVKATSAELMDGVGTEVPNSIDDDPVPVFGEGATVAQKEGFKRLQGTAYKFLCDFMEKAEPSPPRRLSGCLPCRLPTPPTLTPPTTVSWKDSMVQVRSRNGRWAWVLKKNEAAFRRGNRDAASAGSGRPPSS